MKTIIATIALLAVATTANAWSWSSYSSSSASSTTGGVSVSVGGRVSTSSTSGVSGYNTATATTPQGTIYSYTAPGLPNMGVHTPYSAVFSGGNLLPGYVAPTQPTPVDNYPTRSWSR